MVQNDGKRDTFEQQTQYNGDDSDAKKLSDAIIKEINKQFVGVGLMSPLKAYVDDTIKTWIQRKWSRIILYVLSIAVVGIGSFFGFKSIVLGAVFKEEFGNIVNDRCKKMEETVRAEIDDIKNNIDAKVQYAISKEKTSYVQDSVDAMVDNAIRKRRMKFRKDVEATIQESVQGLEEEMRVFKLSWEARYGEKSMESFEELCKMANSTDKDSERMIRAAKDELEKVLEFGYVEMRIMKSRGSTECRPSVFGDVLAGHDLLVYIVLSKNIYWDLYYKSMALNGMVKREDTRFVSAIVKMALETDSFAEYACAISALNDLLKAVAPDGDICEFKLEEKHKLVKWWSINSKDYPPCKEFKHLEGLSSLLAMDKMPDDASAVERLREAVFADTDALFSLALYIDIMLKEPKWYSHDDMAILLERVHRNENPYFPEYNLWKAVAAAYREVDSSLKACKADCPDLSNAYGNAKQTIDKNFNAIEGAWKNSFKMLGCMKFISYWCEAYGVDIDRLLGVS